MSAFPSMESKKFEPPKIVCSPSSSEWPATPLVWFWTEPLPYQPYPLWIKSIREPEMEGQPTRPKKKPKRTASDRGHWRTWEVYATEWKVAFASVQHQEKKSEVDTAVDKLCGLSLGNKGEPQANSSLNK